MKKTLTAALAISAIASLALATEIETDNIAVALDIDATASGYIANPLGTTLGDIDGSSLSSGDFIRVINAQGKKEFDASWDNDNRWIDKKTSASCNDYQLSRGTSVQFSRGTESTATALYVAGLLNRTDVPITLTPKAYNFLGNASVNDKTLGDITISGFKAASKDYVFLNGTKYVYFTNGNNSGWCTYTDYWQSSSAPSFIATENLPTIGAGKGFYVFIAARANGVAAPSITLEGSL